MLGGFSPLRLVVVPWRCFSKRGAEAACRESGRRRLDRRRDFSGAVGARSAVGAGSLEGRRWLKLKVFNLIGVVVVVVVLVLVVDFVQFL